MVDWASPVGSNKGVSEPVSRGIYRSRKGPVPAGSSCNYRSGSAMQSRTAPVGSHLGVVVLLFMGVLALLFATAGEATACGTHGTNAGNDLNDWLFSDTDGDGFVEAFIGIEDLFVPPTTTICISGIGLGTSQNPLASNVEVTAARIAIANVVTREIENLGAGRVLPR